ncbi:hypothetical protein GCM10010528_24500 [Gordonia defluvii]|uniref:Uncharacterized protein n=2 Tax=Gordonia defluvii TaxID=283718 RepID=A0ABP6LLR9_9ACTN
MQLIWFEKQMTEEPHERGVYFYDASDEDAPHCAYRVSTDFEVIEGNRMPLWLEVEAISDVTSPHWGARVELVNGAPRIVSLGFETRYGFDIGREVKVSDFQVTQKVIYDFYSAFTAALDKDGEPVRRIGDVLGDRSIRDFLQQRRTGRKRLRTPDYERAAQIYRENIDGTPTQAVSDAFGVGIRQGGNIVAECRRRQLLPPTRQGRKRA